MQTALIVVGLVIAVLFSALVLLTGKGDAMSGGGGVRTTYKGKASFDDQISKVTLGLFVAFMAVTIIIDIAARSSK